MCPLIGSWLFQCLWGVSINWNMSSNWNQRVHLETRKLLGGKGENIVSLTRSYGFALLANQRFLFTILASLTFDCLRSPWQSRLGLSGMGGVTFGLSRRHKSSKRFFPWAASRREKARYLCVKEKKISDLNLTKDYFDGVLVNVWVMTLWISTG